MANELTDSDRAAFERCTIPDAEVLQDIADTEAEIAQVILLAPMIGEAAAARHLAINEERRAFVAKLRRLLEYRALKASA